MSAASGLCIDDVVCDCNLMLFHWTTSNNICLFFNHGVVIISATLTRSWMSQNLLIKNHQHGLLLSNFEAKVMTDVVKAAVAGPNRPHLQFTTTTIVQVYLPVYSKLSSFLKI